MLVAVMHPSANSTPSTSSTFISKSAKSNEDIDRTKSLIFSGISPLENKDLLKFSLDIMAVRNAFTISVLSIHNQFFPYTTPSIE